MKTSQQRMFLILALVLILNIFYLFSLSDTAGKPYAVIAYSQFKALLEDDRISEVTITGDSLKGIFTEELYFTSDDLVGYAVTDERPYLHFQTTIPPGAEEGILKLLEAGRVRIVAQPVPRSSSGPSSILFTLLSWGLIIGIWWFFFQQIKKRGGIGGNMFSNFGKSGAELYSREKLPVTFSDVAGMVEPKRELEEIVEFLRNPQKFTRLGGKVPRGVLLCGPPGTGKTLLARAVAGEAEVPFFSISASQFVEMFVGVGASRVRDLFSNAKKSAPSMIFVDELDAVGRARGTGLGGGHDEREQTLNQLLSELDGFNPHDEVIVLAATNRPDVLDAALLRPGRFDRQVVIERPDWRDRAKILAVHTRNMPLAGDVNLEQIAKGTPGLVGADLQGIVNEAALIAAREDAAAVTMDHFERAKDRQLMGIERSVLMAESERWTTAVHEAGHALVAAVLPQADPVNKITIIPHGQALGMTQQLPADDRYHLRSSYLFSRMAVILGGRAAELAIFEEPTSGAQNDLKQVMDLAERMVCQWGMSVRLGPLSYPRGEEHPFLGRKLASDKTFSEKTAWIIDQEIKNLVAAAQECTNAVIEANHDTLIALSKTLMAEETIDKKEFCAFMEKHPAVIPETHCEGMSYKNHFGAHRTES